MRERIIKKLILGTPFILMALIIAGYSYFRTQDYINGPQVAIALPQNIQTVHDPLFKIEGQTKNIADITLDDRKIFTDKKGTFIEEILIHPGYNIIIIEAKDKFNKIIKKRIEVVLQENNIKS